MMKGIILAGGKGSRLFPVTKAISKQLLPIYDKPMIYYPLSILMLAGIREILLISTPEYLPLFQSLLGSGKQWGINIAYLPQNQPRGLPEAFIIGENFINGDTSCLILGDNIFYGSGLIKKLQMASSLKSGSVVFAYSVKDPERYGIVTFDSNRKVTDLEEKPVSPKSNYAIPGIYFCDHRVVDFAKQLTPSPRGETEIIDLLGKYLELNELKVLEVGRGVAWLDAGTHESLLQASRFIGIVQERQGLMISCPEEIAYRLGFITRDELKILGSEMDNNEYGQYLIKLYESEGLL
jgi:glucose-1-phosphate thymidylyltransferase